MRHILVLFIVAGFLFACNEEPKTPVADKKVEFSVQGMVCEMGCGASLRKGLLATGAVTQVDVSYEEEAPSNAIVVYFDSELTDVEKLLNAILELNDGQFNAEFLNESSIETAKLKIDKESESNFSKDQFLKVKESQWSFPNLTQLINQLIP